MKKYMILLGCLSLMMTACQGVQQNDSGEEGPQDNNEMPTNTENNANGMTNEENDLVEEVNEEQLQLHTFQEEDEHYLAIDELADSLEGSYEYDDIDKTLTLTIADREFYFVYGVPVVEVNGEYLATEDVFIVEEDGEPFVTSAFIEKGLETDYTIEEPREMITVTWDEKVVEAWQPTVEEKVDIHSFTTEDMIDYLSFLERPIEGASVSTIENHLPGAPREYRNGYHEGIDWYDYSTGAEITTDTPVYGMAEGTVVRVDSDFEDYSSESVRNEDLQHAAEIGHTPEYILDRLRGKQVWVQYDNGIMNRFAHLNAVADDIEVGQVIDEKTIIGYVGNSGTSSALEGGDGDLHLHQDLLIYGELFWKPFTLNETTEILQELWP
ncbi:M23 family metallopeptidase [Salipaludibacillus agaradhaerens]|jgi:murein DD-endopeptidase MepM/ murein hydrolase activator NlpD|uniref:M23 family metallopeptidase n=1 Tax=Salipaludibacillus agaradhaerens TaxID=76935 RepID=UPI0009985406|nr:M23 family metallopeptidase [Salipaludibacillus agaradhaerens]